MSQLTAKAAMQITKTPAEVFDAIIYPQQMCNYFIANSSGIMEVGNEVIWCFPEFPNMEITVTVTKIIPEQIIEFVWDPESVVNILLEEQTDGSTVVKVTETGKKNDEAGIKWAIGQTEGWANFLACMKAWLEYHIHLRKGAFTYLNN